MLWFSRPAPVPWSMHLSDPLTTLRKALTSRCRATEVQKPLIDTPAGHLVPYRELLDVFRKCEELTEEEQPRFRGLEQPTQEDLQVRTSCVLHSHSIPIYILPYSERIEPPCSGSYRGCGRMQWQVWHNLPQQAPQ